MFTWITANLSTIIIAAVLIAVCVLIIVKLCKDKKTGKTSCGCGCSGCSMNGMCHPQIKKGK